MADPRFYTLAGPFTLSQLADLSGATIEGDAEPGRQFTDVQPLAAAGAGDVGFIVNRRYAQEFSRSKAGACLLAADMARAAPAGMALLVSGDPYRAYALVAGAFYPETGMSATGTGPALIDASATVAAGAEIGPGAEIGADCRIGPGAVIGAGVVIGEGCQIGPSVSVAYALIGSGVTLHAGVRIGSDGFGFAPGAENHEKVPQLGRVIIGDDVEIGANSAVDRGSGPDTVIGAGSKIDNLVQIGHNVRIGKGCLIAAQVGIAGSTEIGDLVMIGGQAGIAGHLKIGDGARIAGQAGVTHDVAAGQSVAGMPATEAREHWRKLAVLGRLARKRKSG